MEVGAARSAQVAVQRYRFVILGVVWTAYLIVYLARLTVGPLAPFLKNAFSLDNAEIGGLTSASALAYGPTLIVAGWLADRFGARRFLVAGTFVAGICVVLMFFASSYAMLFDLLVLSGLGCGFIQPSAIRAVMLWFPPRERATAIGFNQTAINVSGVIGGLTLPALAFALGWQYCFLVVGLVALVICGACFVLYRDPPGSLLRLPADDTGLPSLLAEPGTACQAEVPATGKNVDSHWRQSVQVLKCRDIWVLCVAGLFFGAVEFAAIAHMVLYLQKEYLLGTVAAGGLLAFCQLSGAAAKPGSGFVSDRLLRGRRRPALVVMSLGAAGACVALAGLGRGDRWLVYPCLAVLGATAIGWGGLYGTIAGEIGGRRNVGFATGISTAAVNLGIIAGPPLFGVVVDRTGSYGLAWTLLAAAAAVTAVCFLLVREPQGQGDLRRARGPQRAV
jgi:ACS family hexuronate transporter-like MFS transporter